MVIALIAALAALAGCGVVSVGHPIPPRHVPIAQGGTLELAAPGMRLAVLHAPGADPRDACVATLPAGALYIEAKAYCDVRRRGATAVFVIRGRPTVVAGIAPAGADHVTLDGPGGRRSLPLSRHRAFLAVYPAGTRGRVSVDGRTAMRHRRRGAVYSDEIGEKTLHESYAEILRRFGPPAARGRHRGRRCLRYEIVGQVGDGWWFCARQSS